LEFDYPLSWPGDFPDGVAVSDLAASDRLPAWAKDRLLEDGTRAYMYEALLSSTAGPGHDGWLLIERSTPGPWSPLERRTAQLIAQLTSTVAQRAEADKAVSAARAEAEAANAAKTEFLSRLAHEAGTPLNAITLSAQMLDERLHGEDREDVSSILVGAMHLKELMVTRGTCRSSKPVT
jgi:signal transduction histidine kinase